MKIALIGATGYVGSAIYQELQQRGHDVTVSRVDVQDRAALTQHVKGHDAVISAFSGHAQGDVYGYYVQGIAQIIAATQAADVPRLLVVGGAGSLEVAPGVQLVDTPQFPEQWKATAEGAREALRLLKAQAHLNWTMLSPAAHLEPGARTGVFRLGGDQLLVDAAGESRISLADYAKAMVDELENPKHSRQRFSVAY